MHIFIDETGSFSGIGEFPSVSLVGALVVPDERLASLEKQYNRLSRNFPRDDRGEVKGRALTEKQVASLIPMLFEHSTLFDATGVDVGAHTEDGLKQFQAEQAERMTNNLTDKHSATLTKQVWAYRDKFEKFKLPLMIQTMATFELIPKLIELSTNYYATRRPTELAEFHWTIDAKGNLDTPNQWEEWWSTVIMPFLQSRSFKQPFKMLPVGDYSKMKRFDVEPDDFIKEMSAWTEGDPPPLDIKAIISDNLQFRSDTCPGLELVDILTNATRRAMNGNLQKEGWRRIPELMIHRNPQYINLIALEDLPKRVYPYSRIVNAYSRGGRALLPAKLHRQALKRAK
ncbi:hypothetical protein [Pseudolabrys sp. FHR47]|uniref:hypothetical protein n=1 Tax=Pseudolabrys sp. FHR47 TaxID=2562284 RepID=UPI0010BE9B4F|nr:hypothetical protein [Pseudolabrys sp. FHR47]